MAQQVTTTLIDDIDGSEASETVLFGLDGTADEIDLTEAHDGLIVHIPSESRNMQGI